MPAPTYLLVGDRVPVLDPSTGASILLPKDRAIELGRAGKVQYDTSEETREKYGIRTLDPSEATEAPVLAAGMGALRSATFGLSDVAARAAGGEEAAGALRTLKEQHPLATFSGEMGGLLMPGGLVSAVGKGARAATAGVSGAKGAILAAGLEGAAYGAGQGVSDVALSPGEIDPGTGVQHIATAAGKAAAFGGAFGAAALGLGSFVRFGRKRITTAVERRQERAFMEESKLLDAKVHAEASDVLKAANIRRRGLTDQQKTLTKSLKELGEAPANPGLFTAWNKQKTALADELAAVDDALAAAKRDALDAASATGIAARIKRESAAEYAQLPKPTGLTSLMGGFVEQKMAGGAAAALGGFGIGGIPGAVAGFLLAPAAMALVKNSLLPAGMKGAGALARAGARAAPMAKTLAVAGQRQATRMISASEYQGMVRELMNVTPESASIQLMANLAGVPDAEKDAIIQQEIVKVEFLKEKVAEEAPPLEDSWLRGPGAPTWSNPEPGAEARMKLTRCARATLDPETVPEDFAARELTPQAMDAALRCYPEQLAVFQGAVESEVCDNIAAGAVYNWIDEQQISLLLGQESRMWRLSPYNASSRSMEPPGQKAAPEGLDEARMTELQKLSEE